MADDVDEDRRRAVFAAVVAAQDRGLSVAESRRVVSEGMGVTVEQVRAAEAEGLRNEWPPLGE